MKPEERLKYEFNLGLIKENYKSIKALSKQLEGIKEEVVNTVYPVGSIYISLSPVSPELLFGKKWERITDCFLLGEGSIAASGQSGGSLSHNHSLENAFAELGTAGADIRFRYKKTNSWAAQWYIKGAQAGAESTSAMKEGVSLGGSTSDTSTLPPYLAVYMWKRIS